MFHHSPPQGAFTPPMPNRPTTPSQTTTPQSLGFPENVEHWDAKAKYGLKLLKRVASTPYSRKAGISGCPIEQVPALAIIRHGWSSYWLRYLSNGQKMFPVMSKSIADAVLASELLSMIRQRKINTDAAATAYAWEHSLPMDRTSAVKALAEDFCDYMEDLIHKKQVAGNASNSAQHTMGTPAAVQAASQGIDPASSHRITQLEVQLAKAQHTIKHLQANASGQASLAPGQRQAETTATRGRTIQEQIDRLTQEVGPPEPILPQVTEQDVVEIAESIPASQDTVIFSPSRRPLLDQDEPSPADTPFNPKRKLTFSSPGNTQPTSGAAASTQGTETSASTRPPTKRLRQATLTGKPMPAARQAGEIFNTPTQPSAWFTANYTGVHTESGIVRWFGGLKIPDKKKNEVRQYIETVMTQFPSISEEQRSNLDRRAVAQGIAGDVRMTIGESRCTKHAQGSRTLDTMDPANVRSFPSDHRRGGRRVEAHAQYCSLATGQSHVNSDLSSPKPPRQRPDEGNA